MVEKHPELVLPRATTKNPPSYDVLPQKAVNVYANQQIKAALISKNIEEQIIGSVIICINSTGIAAWVLALGPGLPHYFYDKIFIFRAINEEA